MKLKYSFFTFLLIVFSCGSEKASLASAEVQKVMPNIYDAYAEELMTSGESKKNINELENLKVDENIKSKWSFDWDFSKSNNIIATSTEIMEGGPGHKVAYCVFKEEFMGYGTGIEISENKRPRPSTRNVEYFCDECDAAISGQPYQCAAGNCFQDKNGKVVNLDKYCSCECGIENMDSKGFFYVCK